MKIFTWHIHGSYLFYLSQGNYDIYIPTRPEKGEGYYGRGDTFPFGTNVIEIPADEVKNHDFDCILFQTNYNYEVDQYEILSDRQRELPKIYLEHDPPRKHPTDTRHLINDPDITLVHVTHFNRLMWDSGQTPAVVIEHGVTDPGLIYDGRLNKGIVVINNLPTRGRLLGFDVFQRVQEDVLLDLVGMGTGNWGLGEVLHPQLPKFQSQYRFFFNPIRYTSLGLAICEAMMMGIPVVGLATTELSAVIINGENGIIHTDVDYLIEKMQELIANPSLAAAIGARGRVTAMQRFSIHRFAYDWESLFKKVIRQAQSIANEINSIEHE
jgi:glycosyltransferase involved in cell wall biosynthesis